MKYLLMLLSLNLYAQDFSSYDNIGLVAELVSAHKNSKMIKELIVDFEEHYQCQCKPGISTFPFEQGNLIRTRYRCKVKDSNKKLKLIVTSEYSATNSHYQFNLKGIRIKERP